MEPAIKLEGEYDLTRKDEVAALFAAIDGGDPIVIDMTGVTYIDSTILYQFAALKSRQNGNTIRLTGLNPHIRRVLRIVKFDELFDLSD